MNVSTQNHDFDRPIRVGVFDTVDEAAIAVRRLLEAGFPRESVTVVCSDETKEQYFREFEHQQPAGQETPVYAVTGGLIGALAGGMTVVAFSVATGGVALLAAAPISAGVGGVIGGFVGAMMSRGVEKELANYYSEAVVAGRLLVAAEAHGEDEDARLAIAERILATSGAAPVELPEG
jgi:predicted lipid-binding transport protein (Tim44 family)